MTPEVFIRSIERKKEVPPLTVCAGEEPFFMEEVFTAIRAALSAAEPRLQIIAWEAQSGESDEAGASRLLAEMQTPGLFSPRKLIWVRDGQKLLKAAHKKLLDVVDDSPSGNALCIFAGSVDGRTKLARGLKERDALVVCRKLYSQQAFFKGGSGGEQLSELGKWVMQRARLKGLTLERAAAEFLMALTGNNLYILDSELEKLELGSDGAKHLTVEHVERSTGMSAVHTPFELWEEIEKGNVEPAIKTLRVILRNGLRSVGGSLVIDPAGIAAILLKIFRDRIRLASEALVLHLDGLDDKQIQDVIGIKSPFYFKKIKGYSSRLNARKHQRLHDILIGAERRIKQRGYRPHIVLEDAVIRIAAVNR